MLAPSKPEKQPSLWTKTTEKVKKAAATLTSGDPIARLTSTIEAPSLWPAPIEQESHQASLILRGFFLDGFIIPYRTLSQIPREVLRDCKGVAVFHILKPELRFKSVAGSGVVVARKGDGEWSFPSGIAVREDEIQFPDGVDCLDVICVINTFAGMKGFSDPSCRLGRDISIEAGVMPKTGASVGGFKMPSEGERADVWMYVKGKGHAVDVNFDGVMIVEREEENARYYAEKGIVAKEILAGRVLSPTGKESELLRTLHVIKSQESDYGGLPHGKSPGDCSVKKKLDSTFGAWVGGNAGSAP